MSADLQLVTQAAGPLVRSGLPIQVVVADDHRLVRRSLRLSLQSEGDIEVVAEASDLFTAQRCVHRHRPRVLVLDLEMPGGSSIELIHRLQAQMPDTVVVVMSMEDSPVFARHVLDAGGAGYVLKQHADDELAAAIRLAAQGQRYVSPRVRARLEWLGHGLSDDHLTPRETDVLRLIALGLTTTEIAARLGLSPRTIDSHRRRIHRKLGLARRSDLVAYALAQHMVGDRSDDADLSRAEPARR